MALITNALLQSLRTGFRAEWQAGFDSHQAASFHARVATEIMSTTASNTYGWLGDFPDLIEWVGARTVKSMKEHSYQIANVTYEGTVGISRDAIEDDNLGVYMPRFRQMGLAAARQPDQLVAALMKAGDTQTCYDGQFFFDTDHPVNAEHDGSGADASVSNILAGGLGTDPQWFLLSTNQPLKPFINQVRRKPEFVSKESQQTSDHVFMNNEVLYGTDARRSVGYGFWQQAIMSRNTLDEANFNAAWKMMAEFTGDGGRPLGLMPDLLMVPPALRAAANAVIEMQFTGGGDSNPNYKAVDVVICPWLA